MVFSFKILDSVNSVRSPGTNFKPWPSSHLLVPPVRSLPSRCRHHLAQRLRRPLQATGHGEPPNLTLAAGCRHHPAAERPVAAAGAHWKVCTRGNKRRSCTAPCSCRASCVLQAVAHTRSLATPGCFTTTVHRGSQVQVRGALSTRHCGFMCTLSAQRACCVCLRYARLRFPCSRCVHLLFVSCAVVRALAVHSRAARLRAGSVVHLCRVLPDCAASARQRRRHRGGAPARALSWRACLRCRACVSHARVACTCCACPRCARSCGACGVLVQRSPTPCGARRHRRQHTPDQPLVDPGDLTCPFPILSPIALLLLDHMHVPAMLH